MGCQLTSSSSLSSAANSRCKVGFGPLGLSLSLENKDVGQDHSLLPAATLKSKAVLFLGPSSRSAGARGRRQQTKKKNVFSAG